MKSAYRKKEEKMKIKYKIHVTSINFVIHTCVVVVNFSLEQKKGTFTL